MPTDIRLIAAHPDWNDSRVNRRLLQQARALARVDVLDLYGRYPDYAIDVAREQAALSTARLLVLMHPVHWYGMPALLKLWVDEVLSLGWAYGAGGTALQGKTCWLVASTGGPAESYTPEGYNRFAFEAFLPPYIQTARLCGMRFAPPMLIHGAQRLGEAELQAQAERFGERLRFFPDHPDWAGLADGHGAAADAVPRVDRGAGPGAALGGHSAADTGSPPGAAGEPATGLR